MSLQEKFTTLAEEWAGHCRTVMTSSNIEDYLRHPSYRALTALGREAAPLVMDRYRTDELLPWEFVLQEITGERMIDNPNDYNVTEVRRRWFEWWERQPGAARG